MHISRYPHSPSLAHHNLIINYFNLIGSITHCHLLTHSLTYSFIHSFIRTYIHSFFHQFIPCLRTIPSHPTIPSPTPTSSHVLFNTLPYLFANTSPSSFPNGKDAQTFPTDLLSSEALPDRVIPDRLATASQTTHSHRHCPIKAGITTLT